jgi:hypothetical protein
MHVSKEYWAVLLSAMLVPAWGCGGKSLVSTSGTVTLDGQPLDRAVVNFHSETSEDYAYGMSQSDGAFHLQTNGSNGVSPGSYRVTITKFGTSKEGKGKQSILPKIYSSSETTPFQFTIPHDGPILLKLDSEAKPRNRRN